MALNIELQSLTDRFFLFRQEVSRSEDASSCCRYMRCNVLLSLLVVVSLSIGSWGIAILENTPERCTRPLETLIVVLTIVMWVAGVAILLLMFYAFLTFQNFTDPYSLLGLHLTQRTASQGTPLVKRAVAPSTQLANGELLLTDLMDDLSSDSDSDDDLGAMRIHREDRDTIGRKIDTVLQNITRESCHRSCTERMLLAKGFAGLVLVCGMTILSAFSVGFYWLALEENDCTTVAAKLHAATQVYLLAVAGCVVLQLLSSRRISGLVAKLEEVRLVELLMLNNFAQRAAGYV